MLPVLQLPTELTKRLLRELLIQLLLYLNENSVILILQVLHDHEQDKVYGIPTISYPLLGLKRETLVVERNQTCSKDPESNLKSQNQRS